MKKLFAIIVSLALFSILSSEVLAAKPELKSQGPHDIVTGEITAVVGGTTLWMEFNAHDTDPEKGHVTYRNSSGGWFTGDVDCFTKDNNVVVFGGNITDGNYNIYKRFGVEIKDGNPDLIRVPVNNTFDCSTLSGVYPGTVTEGDIVIHNAADKKEYSGESIDNKWNLSGTFLAFPGYNWNGLVSPEKTWEYHFSIKQALDTEKSVGSVHFKADGVDVVGHIEDFKTDYSYWAKPNIAAVGTAEYNGGKYKFMLLYSKRAVWFVLSSSDYASAWEAETTLSPRLFQVHSENTNNYPMDYLDIH